MAEVEKSFQQKYFPDFWVFKTPKVVRVQHVPFAIMSYLLTLLVFLYTIVYSIIGEGGYMKFSSADGIAFGNIRPPDYAEANDVQLAAGIVPGLLNPAAAYYPYCSQSGADNLGELSVLSGMNPVDDCVWINRTDLTEIAACIDDGAQGCSPLDAAIAADAWLQCAKFKNPCRVEDEYYTSYPASNLDYVFVTTRVKTTTRQRVSACSNRYDACSANSWEMYETVNGSESVEFITGAEDFTVRVRHSGVAADAFRDAPEDLKRNYAGSNFNEATALDGEVLDYEGETVIENMRDLDVPGRFSSDIFRIGDLLNFATGESYDMDAMSDAGDAESVRSAGLVMFLLVTYRKTVGFEMSYEYQPILIMNSEAKFEEVLYNADDTHTIRNRHGVLINFIVTGEVGTFDTITLIANLMAGVILYVVIKTAVLAIMLNCLQSAEVYRKTLESEGADITFLKSIREAILDEPTMQDLPNDRLQTLTHHVERLSSDKQASNLDITELLTIAKVTESLSGGGSGRVLADAQMQTQIRSLFHMADVDQAGLIHPSEFARLFPNMRKDDRDVLMQHADKDGEVGLTMSEFSEFVISYAQFITLKRDFGESRVEKERRGMHDVLTEMYNNVATTMSKETRRRKKKLKKKTGTHLDRVTTRKRRDTADVEIGISSLGRGDDELLKLTPKMETKTTRNKKKKKPSQKKHTIPTTTIEEVELTETKKKRVPATTSSRILADADAEEEDVEEEEEEEERAVSDDASDNDDQVLNIQAGSDDEERKEAGWWPFA